MSHALNSPTIQATNNPYVTPQVSALPNEALDAAHKSKVLNIVNSLKFANMTAIALCLIIGFGLAVTFLVPIGNDIGFGVFVISMPMFMIFGVMFLVSYFSMACRHNGIPFGICVFCASFLVPFTPIILYLLHYCQVKEITDSAGIKFGLVGPEKKSLERFRSSTQPKLDYGFPVKPDGRVIESAQ